MKAPKQHTGLISVAATALFVFAGCIVVLTLLASAQLASRHLLLMGGLAALLIGYGGILTEYLNKDVMLRPDSWGLKFVCGGAVSMAVAMAL